METNHSQTELKGSCRVSEMNRVELAVSIFQPYIHTMEIFLYIPSQTTCFNELNVNEGTIIQLFSTELDANKLCKKCKYMLSTHIFHLKKILNFFSYNIIWAYCISFSNFLDPLNLPNCPTLFSLSLSMSIKSPKPKTEKWTTTKSSQKGGKLPNQTHSEIWGHALECGWYSHTDFLPLQADVN